MSGFITSSPASRALRRVGGRLATEAADEIDRLRDALSWCGGSPSFAPGGEAHEGWEETVRPLMDPDYRAGPHDDLDQGK